MSFLPTLRPLYSSLIKFGCFGNPMKYKCHCCNTDEKNLKNFQKHLDHFDECFIKVDDKIVQNFNSVLSFSKSEFPNYYIFSK